MQKNKALKAMPQRPDIYCIMKNVNRKCLGTILSLRGKWEGGETNTAGEMVLKGGKCFLRPWFELSGYCVAGRRSPQDGQKCIYPKHDNLHQEGSMNDEWRGKHFR